MLRSVALCAIAWLVCSTAAAEMHIPPAPKKQPKPAVQPAPGETPASISNPSPEPVKLPPPAHLEQIQQWIKELASDDSDVRHVAQRKLLLGGNLVLTVLKDALSEANTLDLRMRLNHLIDALDGFGAASNGIAIKITPDKTRIKPSEPVQFRIQYHNRTDFPLVVRVGDLHGPRAFVRVHGNEDHLSHRMRNNERCRRWPASSVLILPHDYAEEIVSMGFIPMLNEARYDDYDSRLLPAGSPHFIAISLYSGEPLNPNYETRNYVHGELGLFTSNAAIWQGKTRSNLVELTLLDPDSD